MQKQLINKIVDIMEQLKEFKEEYGNEWGTPIYLEEKKLELKKLMKEYTGWNI